MKNAVYLFLLVLLTCCQSAEIKRVKLTELSGEPIDMGSMKGKTVFIHFWATWCGPCIREMPTIEEAMLALKDQEVIFLFASNEEPAEISDFAKSKPFAFHYVRLMNMEELKIPALPTTYIFDSNGKLVFSETGSRNWSEPNNLKLITASHETNH